MLNHHPQIWLLLAQVLGASGAPLTPSPAPGPAPGPDFAPAGGLGTVDGPYNVIEFLLDDVGMELFELYDAENAWPAGFPYPSTPNIDAVAQSGIAFRNYWAHPVCSPDRAAALTGRYPIISPAHPYGTGIGETVNLNEPMPLTPAMMAMPLAHKAEGSEYLHLQVGKWHLGNGQDDPMSPIEDGGMNEYRGCLTNPNSHQSNVGNSFGGDYSQYTHTVANAQGATQVTGQGPWMGTAEVQDSIAMIPGTNKPFILRHWFHYSHSPWRDPVPDGELGPTATMTGDTQFPYADTILTYRPADNPLDPSNDTNTYHFVHRRVKAGLEAADKAIGEVLSALTPVQRRQTIVIIRSDNGTEKNSLDPTPSIAPPTSPLEPPPSYDPTHAKGTVYQQGINVPLIIGAAPGVSQPAWIAPALRGQKVDALCSTVDIWATMAEITLPNWERYQTDGVSLLPILDGSAEQVRDYAFSFHFGPVGACWDSTTVGRAAVRNKKGFKLVHKQNITDELYDLRVDPLEQHNLLPATTAEAHAAYMALKSQLEQIVSPVSAETSFCFGDRSGASCPCKNYNDSSLYCGQAGCANSAFASGSLLSSMGQASVTEDELALRVFGCTPGSIGVFLQFNLLGNGSEGAPFGDGLSCVGGSVVRLETVPVNAQGNCTTTVRLAHTGSITAGMFGRYQFSYRDDAHGTCTSEMNWSNAIGVQWNP